MEFDKYYRKLITLNIRRIQVVFVLLCLGLVVFLFKVSRNTGENEAELIFAHVIFRHGFRNPMRCYATDPYNDMNNFPEGFGNLTPEGKRQQFELGKYLRRRYHTFFVDMECAKDVVSVRSTETPRTIESALFNLQGLLHSNDDQNRIFPSECQPNIFTMPISNDYIFGMKLNCPRRDRAFNAYINTEKYQLSLETHRNLFEYLSQNSGEIINSPMLLYGIYDILLIESLANKTLPKWAEVVVAPGSEYEAIVLNIQGVESPELARFRSGFLIREMLERFKQKITSTLEPDHSLHLYSAHDTTIVPLLQSLGIFDHQLVTFAASVHIELYKLNDEFYLQIFYRRNNEEELLPLNIPRCGTKCSIEQFYDIYKDIIPTTDIEEECKIIEYEN